MPTEPSIDISTIVAFVLVLSRVGWIFVFLPLPGVTAAPAPVRILLIAAMSLLLAPQWPVLPAADLTLGKLIAWTAAEAVYGLALGIAVACVLEVYTLGAQMISLQAGFSYASTIDPTTQADSTVLMVIAQLTAGLLFFALGLDRKVLLAFAHSLQSHPPGSLVLAPAFGYDLIKLTAGIFSTGFRLVLPIMALLFMLDISLGLLGRLNSQLQITTLAFPLKIAVLLALLSAAVLMFPRAISPYVETCFRFIARYT